MVDLKGFRKANNLTQDELGSYLGMKKSFISKVENGKEKLPEAKFRKLLDNDMGWDVSMLVGVISSQQALVKELGNSNELASLRKEVEMLRKLVDELKEEKAQYWDLIQILSTKWGFLNIFLNI